MYYLLTLLFNNVKSVCQSISIKYVWYNMFCDIKQSMYIF